MSIIYLLDTNILSEPTRTHPNPQVMQRLQQSRHSISTASIVWHELLFGCQRLPISRKREQLENHFQDLLVSGLILLPYTQAAAEWHAAERARLTGLGQPPAFADAMIAATAIKLSRHTRMDAGIQSHGCVRNVCHPWLLDCGNPCRNDVVFLNLMAVSHCPYTRLSSGHTQCRRFQKLFRHSC